MIKCNQKIKYLVNPYTEEIIDRTGVFHNITDKMLSEGWVRIWWQDEYAEFEGEKLENIEKSIGLLINSNILKDFKNKSYHIIYSLDNEWFHMVVKGHEICCKNS